MRWTRHDDDETLSPISVHLQEGRGKERRGNWDGEERGGRRRREGIRRRGIGEGEKRGKGKRGKKKTLGESEEEE